MAETDPTPRSTRPSAAGRHAPRRNGEVQRYTIDLDREQRRTLALLAAEWETDKSKIVRSLLFLLAGDAELREKVRSEVFSEDDAPATPENPDA
jgi:hypothetical protein